MSFFVRLRKYSPDQPRDDHGRFAETDAPSDGDVFVSPNVADHLSFGQAVTGLETERHKTMLKASAAINDALHLDARDQNAIGAWADGAENSVMSVVHNASMDQLKTAAAMKGYIADQKAALVFKEAHGGSAVLYSFEAHGSLDAIHKGLLGDGVAFHTLVPHAGGATVYVCDLDGSAADAVEKGAHRHGSNVTFVRGQAAFVGTSKEDGSDREQRDDARQQYKRVIEGARVQGVGSKWDRIHSAWGKTLYVTPHAQAA